MHKRMFAIKLMMLAMVSGGIFSRCVASSDNMSRWDGYVDQAKSFGEGFGYVPPSWRFSFKIWNDAAIPLYALRLGQRTVMGCHFPEDVIDDSGRGAAGDPGIFIVPGSNSGDSFKDTHLEYSFFIVRPDNNTAPTFYSDETKKDTELGAEIGTIFPGIGNLLGAVLGSLTAFIKNQSALHKNVIFEQAVTIDSAGISQRDANVYNFRAYTDVKGITRVERLSYVDVTTQFVGTFYNRSKEAGMTLSFIFDDVPFTVTIEPESFNFLTSQAPLNSLQAGDKNSPTSAKKDKDQIRPEEKNIQKAPRFFTIKKDSTVVAQIPIAPYGLIPLEFTQEQIDAAKADPKAPMPIAAKPGLPFVYTYEIALNGTALAVGAQGLMASMEQSIPILSRQRDITPLSCMFFLQSIQQANDRAKAKALAESSPAPTPYDVVLSFPSNESYWCGYRTKDYSFTKRLLPGQVVTVPLVRPQLSEQKADLYVVVSNSSDEKQVSLFFDRLSAGIIGKDLKLSDRSATILDEATALQLQSTAFGIIDDTTSGGSGIVATLLGYDSFTPMSITACASLSSPASAFYYSLTPPTLSVQDIAGDWSAFLDPQRISGFDSVPLTDRVKAYCAQVIPQWIQLYQTNKAQVADAAKQALMQYGARFGSKIQSPFTDTTNSVLADFISDVLSEFLEGQVSIARPLIIRSQLEYQEVRDQKPDSWPPSIMPLKK